LSLDLTELPEYQVPGTAASDPEQGPAVRSSGKFCVSVLRTRVRSTSAAV